MSEFFARLTTYNLFNYLFPGVILLVSVRYFGIFNVDAGNIIFDLFLSYFAGMTISRVGSVIVEPLFKWLQIVEYAEYDDYLEASEKDEKISDLLEVNNVYRTIVSLSLSLLFLLGVSGFMKCFGLSANIVVGILLAAVGILYIFAYRKQTSYIRRRVEKALKK